MAVRGQAEAISDALALLTPFAENTDEVLKVLRVQSRATQQFVRNTGEVFGALSERKNQLRQLIANSNRVWTAIASRDQELADTFRVLPTFLREGRATTVRATSFAKDANPLIDQLRPAARQISPALKDLEDLSPDLRHFFRGLGPFVSAAKKGLPATSRTLNNTRPVLRRLDPFLRNLTPVLDYLGLYKREIAAFFANDSAATQFTFKPLNKAVKGPLTEDNGTMHVLRVSNPLNPEIMAGYGSRLASNRSNPYTEPGAYLRLANDQPLPVFGSYLCTDTPVPPAPPVSTYWPQRLAERAAEFIFGGKYNTGAAPPCVAQAPLGSSLGLESLAGQTGAYPRLQPLP
jgi:hypothetical protein